MLERIQAHWRAQVARASAQFMLCPNCHRWGRRGLCQWCGFDAQSDVAVALLRAEQARYRAVQRARTQRAWQVVLGLFRVDPNEHAALLKLVVKWAILGSLAGVLAGTASAVFLMALAWATHVRETHPALLYLLPIVGLLVGWVYFRYAGAAARGNNLIIDEVNANREPIPLRMAPLVLGGTVLTHLFGGSAGREGTAIQMGSSLADWLQRRLGLSPEDRRLMLLAGISGGFGSVFGTPLAGFVFGLEVQNVGRIRYEGVVPCLVAAVVGDLVTRAWGVSHAHYPRLAALEPDVGLLLKVILAGLLFGLLSLVFIELTHGFKHLSKNLFGWSPLRPALGGALLIGLTWLVGTQDYLGLSLPLIQHSLDGSGVVTWAFALKLLFTAVTLGTGFLGGEVTPLFVMGATFGFTLGRFFGVDPVFMATLGFVAVFAGASNTPLACLLMGVELFGGGSALYILVACFVAYLASGHRSIYSTQRVSVPKVAGRDIRAEESLEAFSNRNPGWLPKWLAVDSVPGQRLVRAVMSSDPIAVQLDTSLEQLVELVVREGVRTLPVLDEQGVVVGIVTDNDLLRRGGLALRLGLLAGLTPEERAELLNGAPQRRAQDVMTSPAITIPDHARLHAAAEIMLPQHLKRVPVVDQQGHLLGMLTRSDLLRELAFSGTTPLWTAEGQWQPIGWEVPVEQFMATEVSMVSPETALPTVIEAMLTAAQKRVLVVNAEHQLVGLITDGDILERAHAFERPALRQQLGPLWRREPLQRPAPPSASRQTAAEVMSAPVVTVSVGTSARQALQLIMEHRLKRLPVLDRDGRVVGLVGRAGLMRVLLDQPPDSATSLAAGRA